MCYNSPCHVAAREELFVLNRFETFTGAILELSRCLQRLKDLEMKPLGLRGNHVMCLYYLGKHPQGLTMTELAAACREDKAAVSRCLTLLEGRGLVSSSAPQGKRSYRAKLTLTREGQAMVEEIFRLVDSAVAGGGAGLTDAQRDTMYAALNTIIDNLTRYINQREE